VLLTIFFVKCFCDQGPGKLAEPIIQMIKKFALPAGKSSPHLLQRFRFDLRAQCINTFGRHDATAGERLPTLVQIICVLGALVIMKVLIAHFEI